MRLTLKDSTSFPSPPLAEMEKLVGIQLFHVCQHWHGAKTVVDALNLQGFYIELVDNLPEAPGALGYHDIDAKGRPYSKVAVSPSLDNGQDWLTGAWSVVSVVGHEAMETVGNPIVNIWRDRSSTQSVAQELCDPVENTGYRHLGADLSNFVYPSWFNPFGKKPFDYLGQLSAPFTITHGGYMIQRTGGTTESVFGDDMPEWRKTAHTRAALLGA